MDALMQIAQIAGGGMNPCSMCMGPMNAPGSALDRLSGVPQAGELGMGLPMMDASALQFMMQEIWMLLTALMSGEMGSPFGGGFGNLGNPGTTPPGGTAGGGYTGGGGGYAPPVGGSSPGFNTPGMVVDPSQFQGGTETGRRLAAAALAESTDGDSQGGWCARDVKTALRQIGINLPSGDAWTMAAVLAKDSRFREIQVAPDQLDKLPPGAIVVWDKGPGSPYGHVSVALGDGREASDLLRKQMHLRTPYRVFMPL